jgi:hypothetical protein
VIGSYLDGKAASSSATKNSSFWGLLTSSNSAHVSVLLLVSVLAALESEYRQSWDKGTIDEHVHLVPYSLLHTELGFFIVGIQDDLKNILLDFALLRHLFLPSCNDIFCHFDEAWRLGWRNEGNILGEREDSLKDLS